jgi:hypothetical protein
VRSLTLNREALTDLTPADLVDVVGAGQATVPCPYSAVQCLTRIVNEISLALKNCPL